jgi:hypothetical protein
VNFCIYIYVFKLETFLFYRIFVHLQRLCITSGLLFFNFWKYFQLKKVHYIFITRLKHAPADIALKYWWYKNNQWFVTHSLAVSVRLILHLPLHRLSSTTCNSSFFLWKYNALFLIENIFRNWKTQFLSIFLM